MSAICIIPAKGTSKRIPGKNIKDFLGKPIIAYSIETAIASRLFDHVVVSSESPEVLAIADSYTKAGGFLRPAHLAEIEGHPDCGTQEVTRNVLEWFLDVRNQRFDYACCLYPCAPMVTEAQLGMAMQAVSLQGCTYALGTLICEHEKQLDAGQFYFGHSFAFLTRLPLAPNISAAITCPHAIDINEPEDWLAAEAKYKELHP